MMRGKNQNIYHINVAEETEGRDEKSSKQATD